MTEPEQAKRCWKCWKDFPEKQLEMISDKTGIHLKCKDCIAKEKGEKNDTSTIGNRTR